ncbi:hypothetical protein Tco_0182247, partial [Tanacetum coccineum]
MSSPIASQYFIHSLSGFATSQYIRIWEKRVLSSLDVAKTVDSSSVASHSLSSLRTDIQKESQKRPNQARNGKDKVKSKL